MTPPDQFRKRLPTPQIETFGRGHATSWFWRVLPSPLVTLFCLFTAGSITGLALFLGDRFGDGHGYQWSLAAIAVMTIVAGVVTWVRKKRLQKTDAQRATGFDEAVRGSAAGWDTSVSDAAEIARVDELRAKFQQGIRIFQDYGKDLYELPWYVIVGEPGSGKTEAIRHSELRFPPGLQDKLQGAGGTYSMNWWFTSNAVLLDTAGAMLMQPEAAGRFGEFLGLLRTHRPDFPINGLILTLPVDQLLTNSPQVAEEKAAAIAKQLSVVQQALDVRFPLYVLITKSDRLTGFREFVDAEGQASFERQMVGWSNPDPVGTPFHPERLGEALQAVASRLQGRALAVLADPVPRMEGRRRLDEVDNVYAFPRLVRSLETRLQCYLDTIFQTGAWAGKTPFFRGLYFTSALRQGSELDEALAEALDLDLRKLPAGGIFTQEKAVFLRDVFLSKIFPERGLVSRLRDLGTLLRRRLLLCYAAAFGLLLVALLLALMVSRSIGRQLDSEQGDWLTANESWNNGALLASVTRLRSERPDGPPSWHWADQSRSKPLAQLDRILSFSSKPLPYAWAFRPVSEWREFERRRRTAGLSLFEASVFKPVLDAARERIRWDTAEGARRSPETEERLAAAYTQLVLLERWSARGDSTAPRDEKSWRPFFTDLLAYVLGLPAEQVQGQAAQLAELTARAYGGASLKPSDRNWLAEHEPEARYSSLHHGAQFLFGRVDQTIDTEEKRAQIMRDREALLQKFKESQRQLVEWSKAPLPHSFEQVRAQCMDPMREAAGESERLAGNAAGAGGASFESVKRAALATSELSKTVQADSSTLLQEFDRATTRFAGAGETSDGAGWTAARASLHKYEQHIKPIDPKAVQVSLLSLIGRLKPTLENAWLQLDSQRPVRQKPGPEAPPEPDDDAICRYLDGFAGVTLASSVLVSYQEQLRVDLHQVLRFPLVYPAEAYRTRNEFVRSCERLESIERDAAELRVMMQPSLDGPERKRLTDLFESLGPVFNLKKALCEKASEGKSTLVLQVDGVRAPPVAAPPNTQVPVPGTPFISPPPVPVAAGIKAVEITVNGEIEASALDGRKTAVKYDGFTRIQIVVEQSDFGGKKTPWSAEAPWGLLWMVAKQKSNRVDIIRSPRFGFVLEATPDLPVGVWPKRSDFGLE